MDRHWLNYPVTFVIGFYTFYVLMTDSVLRGSAQKKPAANATFPDGLEVSSNLIFCFCLFPHEKKALFIGHPSSLVNIRTSSETSFFVKVTEIHMLWASPSWFIYACYRPCNYGTELECHSHLLKHNRPWNYSQCFREMFSSFTCECICQCFAKDNRRLCKI